MGSKRLAPSPTANPPSPMPVPQPQAMSMGSPIDGGNFAINELPGNTNGPASLPADFNPAFFAQPMSSGTGNPFEVSGQQHIKIPQMGGQIGQGGPQIGQVGQGGPAVGGKCPTCGK